MNIPPHLWPRVSVLFDEGIALGEPARARWLAALALSEPDCAPHVAGLLQAAASRPAHDPLATPVTGLRASALAQALRGAGLQAGAMLGPYKLVQPLGEGGMATVWLAEQTASVLRRVALKIPHAGLEDGDAAAQRFVQERDFLATLEHPHIARLYDAGISDGGVPFLAMELITGTPITTYCNAERLPLPARIALFQQVLAAVGHAHTRLVIHRDLKAGNILVTPQGQVKLLDFGIARLLGDAVEPLPDDSPQTRSFTPECAAPEQLQGLPLSTASDVYSLGVVLYELLTGRRPYRLDAGAGDFALQLRAVAVGPPSQGPIDEAAAQARASTPRQLRHALAGELDAIVMKAMRADPGQRYASVEALSLDLQRHAGHLPVLALPGSWHYRARRFAQRQRWVLLSAGAVLLTFGIGLGAALWQARVADTEARRARAVQAFVKQIFRASAPEQAQGRDIGARELLARGAARLDTELRDQPEVQAELFKEIGEIMLSLSAPAEGKPLLERAIAGYERVGLGDSAAAAEARLKLADLLINESQWEPARALAQRSLDQAQRRFGPPAPWALHAQANLAFIRSQQGDAKGAAALLEQALADHRRGGLPPDEESVGAQTDLGIAYMWQDQYAKARDNFTTALADADKVPSYPISGRLSGRLQLNFARFFLDDNEAVLRDMPDLVAALDKHLGPAAGHSVNARSLWAQVLVATNQFDTGVQTQREVVAHAAGRKTLDGSLLAFQQGVLAILLRSAGRYDEALPLATQALAVMDKARPTPHWRGEQLRVVLGSLQHASGQGSEGLRTLLLAQSRAQTLAGHEKSRIYANLLEFLALAQLGQGQAADAAKHMTQSHTILQGLLGGDDMRTRRAAALRAWVDAMAQPTQAAAQQAFEAAANAYAAQRPPASPAHADLGLMRAELHQAAGRGAQAAEVRAAAATAWRKAMGRDWQPPLVQLH